MTRYKSAANLSKSESAGGPQAGSIGLALDLGLASLRWDVDDLPFEDVTVNSLILRRQAGV